MKKRILCLAFAVLMLLSACAKPADTASEWIPQHTHEGAMSDTGFYYKNNDILYYADFSNGVNVCLCSRVLCGHDDETCEGTIYTARPKGSMFVWDDKLYYLAADTYGTHVFRRNADGSGLAKVASVCTEYVKQKKSVDIENYVLADGFLYYCAAIVDMAEVSGGGFVAQIELYAVGKVNLASGKDEILFTESECTLSIRAARAGEVLCFANTAPENMDAEDYAEQLQESPCQLFTWSEKTQQRTVLFDKVHRECSSVYGFVDGKFYYSYITDENFYNVTEFDIETREETLIGHTYLMLINSRYSFYKADDGNRYILIDHQAGTESPMAFEGQVLRVVNVSDKGLILRRGQYKPGSSSSIAANIYCYVPLSALADGLQETDAIDFYIHNTG